MKSFVGLDASERLPYVCCVQGKVYFRRFTRGVGGGEGQ